MPDPCARCGAPSITTAADSADADARLCIGCGRAWLLAVLDDWDASLPIFCGTATPEAAAQHAEAVARRTEAETAAEAKRDHRAALARAAKDTRDAKIAAERSERVERCAAIVAESPGIDAQSLADALQVSRRTLGRITKLAAERGLIERPGGFLAGYRPVAR